MSNVKTKENISWYSQSKLQKAVFKDRISTTYDRFLFQNTVVAFNYVSLHMDKKLWGDPENFRPERFIKKGILNLSADKSLPFGSGILYTKI